MQKVKISFNRRLKRTVPSVVFYLLYLLLIEAQPVWAIQIVEPAEGAKIMLGTTVRLVVKPDTGEKWKGVYLGFDALKYDPITNIYADKMTIEQDEDIGSLKLEIIAIDETGKEIELIRTVEIVLPPNVTLARLEVDPNPAFLYKLPKGSDPSRVEIFETQDLSVGGIYSDGVQRKITSGTTGTTYTSSNENIVKVDSNGKLSARGVGTATITVRNGDVKAVVKVIVKAKDR